jgi:ureidoglycolate lyase
MMERHPEGSQALLPMAWAPFLVVLAEDAGGAPTSRRPSLSPRARLNWRRNTWHGVLVPLLAPGLFAVGDRIGDGANLEEHWFAEPWIVRDGSD